MERDLLKAKAALRDQVRDRLNAMSPARRIGRSVEACARLKQQWFWKAANSILFFAPLPNEPDIWPLLEDAFAAGKTAALPRFQRDSQTYGAARVQNLQSNIRTGQFGIREPAAHCEEIPPNRLDLVLVPGIAFDWHGRRLGRGGGFYDRLLSAVRGTTCGVAFDEQMVGEVPAGPQDVRVNCILTPTCWKVL